MRSPLQLPKIRALISNKFYDFLFLIETKYNVSTISPLFRLLGFVEATGGDTYGADSGLWVGWKKEAKMSFIVSCSNFVILLEEKYNGRLWYLVLFYGAPNLSSRESVLLDLEEILGRLEYPFLIVGDFNQVEFSCDKFSSNKNGIPGAYEFNNCKLRNELLDIPFKGPRLTWCNNRKGEKRVYERIVKALGSKDWFSLFPSTGIKHCSIQISDHALIEVDLILTKNTNKKSYRLDAWALEYTKCVHAIREAWYLSDRGSPTFCVVRKLFGLGVVLKMGA
ncbi:uncharacterized protein LOC141658369 [Silene latifolia]|uniref:uncharacterized protein LOC141658369 n=1 Tax=Silene latifolia TaxID=37657 RepID=UPI003D780E64